MSRLSNRITKKRLALGITQQDLARSVGVTSHTLSNWENGRRVPQNLNLKRLAKELGVDPEWLTGNAKAPEQITEIELPTLPDEPDRFMDVPIPTVEEIKIAQMTMSYYTALAQMLRATAGFFDTLAELGGATTTERNRPDPARPASRSASDDGANGQPAEDPQAAPPPAP